MPEVETVTVWRAPRNVRIGSAAVSLVLILLSALVLVKYQYLALIGVALVLALVVRTWWLVLRPSLTAGPDGVQVVSGRTPVSLKWSEIRRCEPTPQGLKIVCSGGREVLSRYPIQVPRTATAEAPSEADATAAYLAQRAAWARKPSGPPPVYSAPPPAARPVRAK